VSQLVPAEVTMKAGHIAGLQRCWFCFTQCNRHGLHSFRQV